jgi:hypothetical protein
MFITIHDSTLTAEENELILEAVLKWNRPADFSDDKVHQVKQIFARAFELPDATGFSSQSFPEGMMLEDKNAATPSYFTVMQKTDMPVSLDAPCAIVYLDQRISFVDFVLILARSRAETSTVLVRARESIVCIKSTPNTFHTLAARGSSAYSFPCLASSA